MEAGLADLHDVVKIFKSRSFLQRLTTTVYNSKVFWNLVQK